jgi:PTS system fructose IIA component
MIGLVLVTHGRLADEFSAALEHVMGPQEQMEAITIGANDDTDLCRTAIIEAVIAVTALSFSPTCWRHAVQLGYFLHEPSKSGRARRNESSHAGQVGQGPPGPSPAGRLSTWPRRPVASMSPSPAACLPANERRGRFQRSLRQRWRKRAKHQLRAQPLCEMCLTRGQVTAACICDHVEPHGGDWNRFWLTLPAPSSLPIALR